MPSARNPKLVALDVDGTLLDPKTQSISTAVRDAVRNVADSGTHVIISTGRSILGALPILRELELTSGIALCSNGAVTLDAATGTALTVHTFDPRPVYLDLIHRLPGAIFAAEQIGTGSLVTGPFSQASLHGPHQQVSAEEMVSEPVPRMIANWADHDPSEVRAALVDVRLPSCTYTLDHYEPWVTIVPSGVSKGTSLEKLRAELGVSPADTFAAGDGDNDITMLRWAAHGVAMGQAPRTVRAAADEVTGPVAENGLVTALHRLLA